MPTHALRTLRIIEPNLAGPSGHYAEFVQALSRRSERCFDRIEVAASVRAQGSFAGDARVHLHAIFGARSWRQELAQQREALRSGDPFLVLTARAVHAASLGALAASMRGGRAALERARLYFHWREGTATQRLLMAAAPSVRAHALAIAPTESIADHLRRLGWRRTMQVPYPVLAPEVIPPPRAFAHLLMAGAARMNKGLDLVAGLAQLYAAEGRQTPLLVQTTPKRTSGRRGGGEAEAVARLLSSGAHGLQTSDRAPPSREYGARFAGALVLAPYDPAAFADNVSGVVLDALLRGAPVVASAGSWPGRLVERFGAGSVFAERTPRALSAAIDQVLADWPSACERAQRAAAVLAREHDPIHLAQALALSR